jgi:hypothetical protein
VPFCKGATRGTRLEVQARGPLQTLSQHRSRFTNNMEKRRQDSKRQASTRLLLSREGGEPTRRYWSKAAGLRGRRYQPPVRWAACCMKADSGPATMHVSITTSFLCRCFPPCQSSTHPSHPSFLSKCFPPRQSSASYWEHSSTAHKCEKDYSSHPVIPLQMLPTTSVLRMLMGTFVLCT